MRPSLELWLPYRVLKGDFAVESAHNIFVRKTSSQRDVKGISACAIRWK
jgi:hypothetical protein